MTYGIIEFLHVGNGRDLKNDLIQIFQLTSEETGIWERLSDLLRVK